MKIRSDLIEDLLLYTQYARKANDLGRENEYQKNLTLVEEIVMLLLNEEPENEEIINSDIDE